jgi:hypothetical protein
MAAFIPDIPYQIQILFILTFTFIWGTAFIDDYDQPLPTDEVLRTAILVTIFTYIYIICRDGTLLEVLLLALCSCVPSVS